MPYESKKPGPEKDQTKEDIISEERIAHDSELIKDGAKIKDGRLEVTARQKESAASAMDYSLQKKEAIEAVGGEEKYDELVQKIKELNDFLNKDFSTDTDSEPEIVFMYSDPRQSDRSEQGDLNKPESVYGTYRVKEEGFPMGTISIKMLDVGGAESRRPVDLSDEAAVEPPAKYEGLGWYNVYVTKEGKLHLVYRDMGGGYNFKPLHPDRYYPLLEEIHSKMIKNLKAEFPNLEIKQSMKKNDNSLVDINVLLD